MIHKPIFLIHRFRCFKFNRPTWNTKVWHVSQFDEVKNLRSQKVARRPATSQRPWTRTHGERWEHNEGNLSSLCTPNAAAVSDTKRWTVHNICRSNFLSSDLDCDPVLHRSPVSRSKFSRIFCCTSWLAEYLRSIRVSGNRVVFTVWTSGYSSGIVIPPASVTIFLLEIRQLFFLVEYWWLAEFLRRICCWDFNGCEGLGIRVRWRR